jgi:hypothetical protein
MTLERFLRRCAVRCFASARHDAVFASVPPTQRFGGPQQDQLIASFVLTFATTAAGVPLLARTVPRSFKAGRADAGERPAACEGRESPTFNDHNHRHPEE